MSTWHVDSPRAQTLDGQARIEFTRVGQKGLTVSLDAGSLSIRSTVEHVWWRRGPLWWFASGWRNYRSDVTIAIPSTADGGNLAASATSGSVALLAHRMEG